MPWGGGGGSNSIFIYWTRKVVCFDQIGSGGPLEETGRRQKDSGHRCQLVVFQEHRRHAKVLTMVNEKPISG